VRQRGLVVRVVRKIWQDLAVVALYAVAAMVFYWPALFGGQTLLPLDNLWTMAPWYGPANAVPHNLLVSDMLLQNYPWKIILDQALHHHELPLWNPYEMAGLPYLATGQTGVLYPFVVLFLVLGPLVAYGWYSALHQVLAGTLSYAFLRRLGLGRIGATLGGFVFAFCFFLTVSYIWPMVLGAAIWLPLALWSLTGLARAAESGKWTGAVARDLPVGALAIGLSVLGGHLEITFYSTFAVGLYGVFLAVQLLRKRRRPGLAFGLAAGLAIGLGVLLAGVQLVPFLEVLRSNNRQGDTTYAQVISYALPKMQVFGLLMPDFFGNPATHDYLDLTTFRQTPVGNNALGKPTDPPQTIFWGTKNYVESGGYVGVVPLVLALLGIVYGRSRVRWFFAGLAALSLLLAFGSPLYALIYYGLPFFSQLRTPFRWLYLFDFAAAMLAGMGADAILGVGGWGLGIGRKDSLTLTLSQREREPARSPFPMREGGEGVRSGPNLQPPIPIPLALLPVLLGMGGLAGLLASLAVRHRSIALVGRVLAKRADLQAAFGSAAMLYSYEFRNLAIFFGLLFAGGVLIALAVALGRWKALSPVSAQVVRGSLGALFLLVVAVDLFYLGMPFATKAPASILAQHATLNLPGEPDLAGARYASFGDPVVLRSNLGVLLGIPNVGGYDTIISRDYQRLWSLVEPPVDLPYNQIGRIHQVSSLRSPILDLLGVRYILTQTPLNNPAVRLASKSGGIFVYERPSALPRAFIVGQAIGVSTSDGAFAALASPNFQPGREVVLIGPAGKGGGTGTARVESYLFDRVAVSATTSGPSWLVLADANAPGWTANLDGTPTPVQTADGDLRAVYLPSAGTHQIVFTYHPFSLLFGGYVSFLALIILALIATSPVWRRLIGHYAGQAERVMRNTSLPMATSFLNKAVDFGFAALMLRILGATAAGEYAFAIVLMGYFEIFTNFGLNALITREIARNRSLAGRYLSDAITLRLGLCLLSTPVALGVIFFGTRLLQMSASTTTAFVLLTLALIPGNLNGALSALFNAYERNEVPAIIAVGTNLLRVALSTVVLLAGAGIIGLAAIALFLNVLLVVAFVVATRSVVRVPPSLPGTGTRDRESANREGAGGLRLSLPSPRNLWRMVGEAYPLLINHVLVTIFFKIDFLLLEAMQGALAVGYYSAAYKWVDGFLIIPSTFTFAVFPALSRFAEQKGEGLRATYDISIRVLVCLAIPLSVIVAYSSGDLILLLGGPAFYPQSARALAILIWFLPFSYINGLTQYALIAVNRQKFITRAFLISAGFNLVANLILIPRYSLYAASAITVISEVVLMVPFLIEVRREIGWPDWTRAIGKPALAGILMVLVASGGRHIEPHLALLVALGVYLGALWLLAVFTPEERAVLARMTGRFRLRVEQATGG